MNQFDRERKIEAMGTATKELVEAQERYVQAQKRYERALDRLAEIETEIERNKRELHEAMYRFGTSQPDDQTTSQ